MREFGSEGVPTAGGIDLLPLQTGDPGQRVDGVDADIGDGAAVFALFELPVGARAEHQRVLAAEGDGVDLADAPGLDQVARADKLA